MRFTQKPTDKIHERPIIKFPTNFLKDFLNFPEKKVKVLFSKKTYIFNKINPNIVNTKLLKEI